MKKKARLERNLRLFCPPEPSPVVAHTTNSVQNSYHKNILPTSESNSPGNEDLVNENAVCAKSGSIHTPESTTHHIQAHQENKKSLTK